jgi:hypothetical protein
MEGVEVFAKLKRRRSKTTDADGIHNRGEQCEALDESKFHL